MKRFVFACAGIGPEVFIFDDETSEETIADVFHGWLREKTGACARELAPGEEPPRPQYR